MAVTKYEPVGVYSVVRGSNTFSDNTETLTLVFSTVAIYDDVKNPLKLKEFYRQYSNFVRLTFQYTPAIFNIAQNQDGFSFRSRGFDLRIIDSVENGRESITFTAYYANAGVAV